MGTRAKRWDCVFVFLTSLLVFLALGISAELIARPNYDGAARENLSRAKDCSAQLRELAGSGGPFQVDFKDLDCAFLETVHESIERNREIYPRVESLLTANHGKGHFLMHFEVKHFTRFDRWLPVVENPCILEFHAVAPKHIERSQDDHQRVLGLGLKLTVRFMSQDGRQEEWSHYLRYDTPRDPRRRRSSEQLRPQVDALLGSFFAETTARFFTLKTPDVRTRGPIENGTELKLSRNVTAIVRNEKLRTRVSDDQNITEMPYLPALLDDMKRFFGQGESYRPDEIDQMFIHVTHTCIRKLKTVLFSGRYVADRHSPSVMQTCFKDDTPVILFYFEAYDHKGNRIITEEHDAEFQIGYMDTLYLPYATGLFDVVMQRIETEIGLAFEDPESLMPAQSRRLTWQERGEYTDYMRYCPNCDKDWKRDWLEAFMESQKL